MRREHQGAAAATLRECRTALAAQRSTVLREAVGDVSGAADWRHYPAGEFYDPVSHLQYFYHRHPRPADAPPAAQAEHGHFHLFMRGEGMPAGIMPMLLPELAVANAPLPRQSAPLKRGASDAVCHLVAIAIDRDGEPTRLFTTNRWVTGETWYRADDVIGMLDRIRSGEGEPPALLTRWITALVRLFQPEIANLLHDRDKAITRWRWRWPRRNAFEDAGLEVTSSRAIDLAARLAALEAGEPGVVDPPAARPAAHRGSLPSMAEGWGS